MKNKKLWMGFDIHTTTGSILQPTRLEFWPKQQFHSTAPEAPFHYNTDALTGLALVHLNKHLQNPFQIPSMNFSFAHQAWMVLEPHYEMFQRCQPRIQAIQKQSTAQSASACRKFEGTLGDSLTEAMTPQGVDLAELTSLLPEIEFFEKKCDHALLYNFQIQFNRETVQTLQYLHSFLFNLRALIATDFNAHVQDSTFEALKIDSISDYLPKSDYVANDAVLYWKFRSLAKEMKASAMEEMTKTFVRCSHNATCLIEALPVSFLKATASHELEDTLYLAQMDWLLGTHAGLLFRVREELFGLLEGYEKIFWFDAEGKGHQPAHKLSVNCEITEKHLLGYTAA